MAKNNVERPSNFQDPISFEHFQPTDIQVAVSAFKKLKSEYGPLKPTTPYNPINVSGDLQTYAVQGFMDGVIDENELGAFIGLAAMIQMILVTI